MAATAGVRRATEEPLADGLRPMPPRRRSTTSGAGASNPARAGRTPQPVLFIGGLGRSGTTLVERVLNELPRTFSVGEAVFAWKRGVVDDERCGCGEPFHACPHWSAVGRLAFGGWEQVDVDEVIALRRSTDRTRRVPRLLLRRDHQRLTADQRRYLDHLVAVLVASGRRAGAGAVVLDSSKHLSTAALLTLDPRLDVRVLHVVRDVRGVAYSRTRTKLRPEAGHVAMSTLAPRTTAARWVTDNLGYEVLGRRGVPVMRLRYEDFVAEPRAWVARIARFAGLALSDVDLDFLQGDRATFATAMHSAAGNPVRFDGDHLVLRSDEGWRQHLPPWQRRWVTAIAAPLLARYGYEPWRR